jgi:hypothetical protein
MEGTVKKEAIEKFIAQYDELKTFVAEKPNDERTPLAIMIIAIINYSLMPTIEQYKKGGDISVFDAPLFSNMLTVLSK